VAADTTREGELLKEALQPRYVFTLVRVHLGVSALEVSLRQDRRCSMTGAGDINRVKVVVVDQPVEVNVGEALSGVRAPVAKQPRLNVLELQRLSKQGVVYEVQHPQAEVEAGLPIRVDPA
jgi:hypothetical protein